MLRFWTVLFVDGNPVGYEVMENNDSFLLNPAENPNRDLLAPVLRAKESSGHWSVEGTFDQNLIDQVIEDVTKERSGRTAP